MLLLFAAALAFACPPGSVAVNAVDQGQRHSHCVDPAGLRVGPATVVDARGQLVETGTYRAGQKVGRWTERDGGLVVNGSYEEGRRVGVWTASRAGGAPLFSLTYAPAPRPVAASPGADPRVRRRWSLPARASALDWQGDRLVVRTAKGLLLVEPDGAALLVPLDRAPAGPPAGDSLGMALPLQGGDLLLIDEDGVARRNSPTGHTHVVAATAEGGYLLRGGAGRLAAVDPNGVLRWSSRLAFDPLPPAVADGVIVGARGRELRALSTADGSNRWAARAGGALVRLAGSFDGAQVFTLDARGELLAFDGATGAPRWSAQVVPPNRAAGAILRDDADGLVIIAGGEAWRLDAATGAVRAHASSDPRATTVEPDLYGDLLCAAGVDGDLRCGPPGAAPTLVAPVGRLTAPPLILDDRIYVATDRGELLELDRGLAQAASPAADPGQRPIDLTLDEAPATALLIQAPTAPCGVPPLSLQVDRPTEAPPAALRLDLPLAYEEGETPHFDPRWQAERTEARLTLDLSALWDHQLIRATPVEAGPEDLAALERLLRCEADEGVFDGEVEVDDLGIARRYSGRMGLRAVPAVEGCLLTLTQGDAELGLFSGPAALARVSYELFVDSPDLDAALPLVDGEGLRVNGVVELTGPVAGQREEGVDRFEGLVTLDLDEEVPAQLRIAVEGEPVALRWLPGLRAEPDADGAAASHDDRYRVEGPVSGGLLPLLAAVACPTTEPAPPR